MRWSGIPSVMPRGDGDERRSDDHICAGRSYNDTFEWIFDGLIFGGYWCLGCLYISGCIAQLKDKSIR